MGNYQSRMTIAHVVNLVTYLVFLAIFTATFALFSLGLNLHWGFTGLLNFGHIAFMTVGACVTVVLSAWGVPLILAVLLGAAMAAFLAFMIGLTALRSPTGKAQGLPDYYLPIVTIGVSELTRLVVSKQDWLTEGTFNGERYPIPFADFNPNLLQKLIVIGLLTAIAGLAFGQFRQWIRSYQGQSTRRLLLGIAALVLGGGTYIAGAIALYNYTDKAGLMILVLSVLSLVYWQLELLMRSPWGRVLKAIRERRTPHQLAKKAFWYKLQALMLGGAIAGIAGAFYALAPTSVSPNDFEPINTFNAWIVIILGGAGNNFGTILAAAIFWIYDSITRFVLPQIGLLDDSRQQALRMMAIGLILIILMIWYPQGILRKKDK